MALKNLRLPCENTYALKESWPPRIIVSVWPRLKGIVFRSLASTNPIPIAKQVEQQFLKIEFYYHKYR